MPTEAETETEAQESNGAAVALEAPPVEAQVEVKPSTEPLPEPSIEPSTESTQAEEEEVASKAKLPEAPAEEDSAPRKAPLTPKRPRSQDDDDVAMADAESPESKKRRTEVEEVGAAQ